MDDFVPGTVKAECQIAVLRERRRTVASHPKNCLSAPRPDSTRNHSDCIQSCKPSPLEILACHILEGLELSNKIDAVSHFGVARHRADLWIDEALGEQADRVWLEERVGVDHNRNVGTHLL